jgi:hypothetical protein
MHIAAGDERQVKVPAQAVEATQALPFQAVCQ